LRHNNKGAYLPRIRPWRGGMFAFNIVFALVSCMSLSGCDPVPKDQPAVVQSTGESAILSSQTETLTPDELREVFDTSPDQAYVLGPDDLIDLNMYLHPELSVPVAGAGGNAALITSDGTVGLPLIGNIKLGGLTLQQAQDKLTQVYSFYITNPKVSLQIASAQSLKYYLLGAFTDPDLYQAYVAHGAVKLPVDLHALLLDGDLSQNILLASNDVIVIPSSLSENAYLFGAVGKPGAVQFNAGALSLLQALSSAGLDLTNYTDAKMSRIHIIRSHGKSAEFIIVDATLIMQGKAAPFALEPGDIVFVPPTAFATWNEVLAQILPSLQTISDVLNPFVSIRYLSRNN
jgi:polysaccharide export outer membrane protein